MKFLMLVLTQIAVVCAKSDTHNPALHYIGTAMSSSSDKFFQVMGKVALTFADEPVYAEVLTHRLSKRVEMSGMMITNHVVTTLIDSYATASSGNTVLSKLKTEFPKLAVKLRIKCGSSDACTLEVFKNFVVHVIEMIDDMPQEKKAKLVKIFEVGLHNTNVEYYDIIYSIADLGVQYFNQFMENPTFDNLAYQIVPAFTEKVIAVLENERLDQFFLELFEIFDSPEVTAFVVQVIKKMELAIIE